MEEAEVTVHWPDLDRSVESFTLSTGDTWIIRQGEGAEAWNP